jgi:hypothetical protein
VEVWVEDVVDLYAADIQLTFDATRLQVQDANPGQQGVQVIPRSDLLWPDLVVKREADNDAGTIWYAVTQLHPREPASGSGALFAFNLQTAAVGPAAISVAEITLATRDGDVISVQTCNASYEVAGTAVSGYNLFLPVVRQNS